MDARQAIISSGADLKVFLEAFHLDVKSFLLVLRKTRSIVTGRQVICFLSGLWHHHQEVLPGGIVLDILYSSSESKIVLECILGRAGYSVDHVACPHNLGEWKGLPSLKIIYLAKGQLMQQVVYLIELRRSVVETVLSRVYGSIAGTYITEGGRAVSLFPILTLADKKYWLPERYSKQLRNLVASKYISWILLAPVEGAGTEVSGRRRTLCDNIT